MKRPTSACAEIEQDLIATAIGDADADVRRRVEDHVGRCAPCRDEYRHYRTLDRAVGAWRVAAPPAAGEARARKRLESRLADLRRRSVAYRIFPSPLGNILIAVSDRGVSLVEYLGRHRDLAHSRLSRLDVEPLPDGAELETLFRQLVEYLEGRRTRLEWPLDLRLVRSEFHRAVLRRTSQIPYGAVISYTGLACEVGKPAAARAVAQALRWNPLPIVVPCHRVVGASGSLTGYAGDRIELKERLLITEGIRIVRVDRDRRVPRHAMYVRTPSEGYYCLPTCSWLFRFRQPQRLVLFGSRERAEAAGLRPCDACRPDVRPLPQ